MLYDHFEQEIFTLLTQCIKDLLAGKAEDLSQFRLEQPPNPEFGDFAFPTFKLAKLFRKAPNQIAKDLEQAMLQHDFVKKHFETSTAGPYLNFKIKNDILLNQILRNLIVSKDRLAEKQTQQQDSVVLEFSSPNVAKPFNIYHLRTTMLGNSLYRIFKLRGYNPIAINHLGDWGTQFGALVLAYQTWGDEKELNDRGISYLVELYVRINKSMEADPGLKDTARENFAKLEQGDAQVTQLWKKFVELSLKEFKKTYDRLGVHFDHFWGESFYTDKIPALEEKLKSKKLLVESQGAQVVELEKFDMPPCLIRKQDGSTLYATRDLAAAIYRKEKFNFKRMIYVVGGEQSLHFKQIFKVLELMGFDWSKTCEHVPTGLYRFVDDQGTASKMSTRKGKFVTMEAVLDEAVDRVLEIMQQKGTELPEEQRKIAAEIIGVGAVVYNDLSTDRSHDVNFDLNRVVDFEGETGPYIQYAHTRCLGILRNAPIKLLGAIDLHQLLDLNANTDALEKLYTDGVSELKETEELALIRTLAKLPIVLDQVIEHSRPSYLATFLIDITKSFNSFYRAHKVLVDNPATAKGRLALVIATQRTLLQGLTLLGMKAPERM